METGKKLRSVQKGLWTVVLLLVLGAACFFGGILLAGRSRQEKPVVTSEALFQQLHSASQLTSMEYHYRNMGKFEKNADLNGWTIPLTKSSFILAYDGKITAGIELENIEITVDGEAKTILVVLPEAQILSHEVNESSIEVYDESSNLFNPIKISDYAAFSVQQKQVMEKQAIQEGLLTQAQKKAGEVISQLLKTGNPDYEVIVRSIKE